MTTEDPVTLYNYLSSLQRCEDFSDFEDEIDALFDILLDNFDAIVLDACPPDEPHLSCPTSTIVIRQRFWTHLVIEAWVRAIEEDETKADEIRALMDQSAPGLADFIEQNGCLDIDAIQLDFPVDAPMAATDYYGWKTTIGWLRTQQLADQKGLKAVPVLAPLDCGKKDTDFILMIAFETKDGRPVAAHLCPGNDIDHTPNPS